MRTKPQVMLSASKAVFFAFALAFAFIFTSCSDDTTTTTAPQIKGGDSFASFEALDMLVDGSITSIEYQYTIKDGVDNGIDMRYRNLYTLNEELSVLGKVVYDVKEGLDYHTNATDRALRYVRFVFEKTPNGITKTTFRLLHSPNSWNPAEEYSDYRKHITYQLELRDGKIYENSKYWWGNLDGEENWDIPNESYRTIYTKNSDNSIGCVNESNEISIISDIKITRK